MTGLAAFTIFVLFVMACIGLFLSGIGAIRQARLAQRMFDLRFPPRRQESAEFSEPN
jgi:hypothetical protein